jgi:hypothetical protein
VYDYPYEVFVGGFTFDYSHELPRELIALFTEADRPNSSETSSDDLSAEEAATGSSDATYVVPVSVMRERLEIMGFTNSQWQQELKEFVDKQIEYGIRHSERSDAGTPERKKADRQLAILQYSSLYRWMKKLLSLNDRTWNDSGTSPDDTLQYALFDRKRIAPEPIFTRQLIFLRGALEVVDDDEDVVFDFSNAVYEDTATSDDRLSDVGRHRLLQPVREFERILILTEGRTDAKVMRESFETMRPEIAHMYSYMEHEAFKAEGGTSALVTLARNLAAAGIPNRIVFLFDNDTAGLEGLKRFSKERLPKHYKGITLPPLKFAENYPTIGPTGEALANINECACGIELYCGPKALTREDGQLCPIQWTGYNGGMKRYQGEPLDKDGIKNRFFKILAASANPATDPEFESMRLVLTAIIQLQWN